MSFLTQICYNGTMKLACWKCVYLLMSVAFLLVSNSAFANSAAAKQALAQNATNAVCSSGYNGANPFENTEMFKKDQFKNGCPAGMSYVECLRKSWQEQR